MDFEGFEETLMVLGFLKKAQGEKFEFKGYVPLTLNALLSICSQESRLNNYKKEAVKIFNDSELNQVDAVLTDYACKMFKELETLLLFLESNQQIQPEHAIAFLMPLYIRDPQVFKMKSPNVDQKLDAHQLAKLCLFFEKNLAEKTQVSIKEEYLGLNMMSNVFWSCFKHFIDRDANQPGQAS